MATWSWRRLEPQTTALAASRARVSTGSRMPISTAMMPMTTSSSMRVNARARTTAILRPYWQFEISDLKFPITDRKSSRRLALFLVLMQPDGNEDSAHGDDEDAHPPLAGDSV